MHKTNGNSKWCSLNSAVGKHILLLAEGHIFKQKDPKQIENKIKSLAAFILKLFALIIKQLVWCNSEKLSIAKHQSCSF